MLILIEGVDGAGKSTLVEELVRRLGPKTEVFHKGPPTQHPLAEYEDPLFDYIPGAGRDIICDRWHVGEWVYPKIMGRSTKADDASWWHIEMFLRAKGAITVWLNAPTRTLRERLQKRGEDYINLNMLDSLKAAYTIMRGRAITPSVDGMVSPGMIIRTAALYEAEFARIPTRGSYIGSPLPHLLLIGERRSFEYPYPPAFGPYKSTSGHFLLSHYSTTRPLHRMGLANAYEENLHPLWRVLGEPLVVALGRRAHDELTAASVPHGAVPHPQYVRRFHHRHGREYIHMIERAAFGQEDFRKWRP